MSNAQTEHSAPLAAGALPRFFGTANRRAALGFGVVLLALFFLTGNDLWLSIANYTLIFAIAALGLNVLSGYTGQISLGIAFFMSIGAYTAIWLGGQPVQTPAVIGNSVHIVSLYGLELPIYIWLPAAGIVAAVAGALIGPAALRLKGFYLGIVSLALVFVGIYIFSDVSSLTLLTGGPQGRSFYTPCNLFTTCDPATQNNLLLSNNPEIFGLALTRQQVFLLLNLLILVVAALFVGNVMRSRAGRAFQAVRDHEVGAAIMGVNLFEAKMGAFMLSSFLAGISGALLTIYTIHVSPADWSLLLSIQFVAAIIIGGVASVWGSILGAVFIFALPRIIDQLNILPVNGGSTIQSGDISAIIYGFLIILFLLFEPGGIVGLIRRFQILAQRFNLSRRKGGEQTTSSPNSQAETPFEVEQTALSTGEETQPLAE